MSETPEFKTPCTVALRLLACAAGLSAAITMFTSHDKGFFPFTNTAHKVDYREIWAFKFFIAMHGIASFYSLSLFFLNGKSLLWRLLVILDVMLALALTAVNSVALGMAYLEKNGNSHANWKPICGYASNYCDHVMAAIAAAFIEVGILILLILYHFRLVLNPLLVQ